MFYKTRELSSILLLVEDISTKLLQMQQVNYFAYKKESLIDIVGEGRGEWYIPREGKSLQVYITRAAILDLSLSLSYKCH